MKALIRAKSKEWGKPKEFVQFVLTKRARRQFDNVFDFEYEKFLNNGSNGNGNKNTGKKYIFA